MLEINELERLEAMSDEDLFLEIGQKIEEEEGLSGFPDPSRYIHKGKEWFNNFQPEAQKAICGNQYVYSAIKEKSTFAKLADVVATVLLSSVAGLPVPVATISVLLVRLGIEKLCTDVWAEGTPQL